jgi:hexosaminidase
MKNLKIIFSLLLLLPDYGFGQNVGIIPQPLTVNVVEGEYSITKDTPIIADSPNLGNASYLQEFLKTEYQKELSIKGSGEKGILLNLNPQLILELGEEGYTLEVGNSGINIMAGTTTGVFYGIKSLEQLMIPSNSGNGNITVIGINI